ncbi:MAG: methyltransferase domain-containing protein [Desulfarculus sp.]|nr:MAG: methyltransferase domain-containing protein [Desulfarculus sp.]
MTDAQTQLTRRRYDRLAPFFDLLEAPLEGLRLAAWRRRLLARLQGPRALEAGAGTGKNLPYYPPGVEITALDLSPRMLARARQRAARLAASVTLLEMDVQALDFPDQSFDTVFATFVFCSVPDPVQGLRELRRVCRPAGRLLLLEHLRPAGRLLGWLFDRLNPPAVRLTGANINRRTRENLEAAGWELQRAENLAGGIVWLLEARPRGGGRAPEPAPTGAAGETR